MVVAPWVLRPVHDAGDVLQRCLVLDQVGVGHHDRDHAGLTLLPGEDAIVIGPQHISV